MPIKRNTKSNPFGEKRSVPAKRVAPRRVVARKTAEKVVPEKAEPVPRLMSAQEKRGLILAHAEMRRTRDPVQMMSVWAGVGVTAFLVLLGWWWAVTPTYVQASKQPLGGDTLQGVGSDLQKFQEQVKNIPNNFQGTPLSANVNQATAQLEAVTAEAKQRQEAANALANMINSTSSAGVRSDLFRPATTSTQPVK